MKYIPITLLITLSLIISGLAKPAHVITTKRINTMNDAILQIVKSYPTDGRFMYSWDRDPSKREPYDGSSKDIIYDGITIMNGNSRMNTFCCGLTLEVYIRAADLYLNQHSTENSQLMDSQSISSDTTKTSYQVKTPLTKLPVSKFPDFKNRWFCTYKESPGPGDALEFYKLGYIINDWREVKPGDFVQFWRTPGSGHSAVFIEWLKDGKSNIIGFKYWSSQKSTQGVNYNNEYFTDKGKVIREKTFFTRALPPQ